MHRISGFPKPYFFFRVFFNRREYRDYVNPFNEIVDCFMRLFNIVAVFSSIPKLKYG